MIGANKLVKGRQTIFLFDLLSIRLLSSTFGQDYNHIYLTVYKADFFSLLNKTGFLPYIYQKIWMIGANKLDQGRQTVFLFD